MDYEYIEWPEGIKPRGWQNEFLENYFSKETFEYLLHATPGAGKTFAALMTAYQLIKRGVVNQIVVVSPSANLRTQWMIEAESLGISITRAHFDKTNRKLIYSADFKGVSTTYAQVHSRARQFREYCRRTSTLVILDEVHHCGDDQEGNKLEWGRAIKEAFEPALQKLLLSGTPFRTDNHRIPFVFYEDAIDGFSYARPDFSYGYGQALQDSTGRDGSGVVRPITFPIYNSQVGWTDLSGEQVYKTLDMMRSKERSRALSVLLSPEGDFIKQVLGEADGRLNSIRQNSNHSDAGGLVITRSVPHAKAISKILETITGEAPTVVHSQMNKEDEDANTQIENYRESDKKWIVAVKMISEGVDIKRLRVGVYLSLDFCQSNTINTCCERFQSPINCQIC